MGEPGSLCRRRGRREASFGGFVVDIRKYRKQEIALSLLETALGLYFAKQDLFSVVTLAGAAEEILGQLLLHGGPEPKHLFRGVLDILRPHKRKADDATGAALEDDLYVHMDVEQEALFLLGRAIDDYGAVAGALSARMARFNEEVRGRKA